MSNMVATGQELVRGKKFLQGQRKVREFHFRMYWKIMMTLVVTVRSGGTASGIATGNIVDSKLKCHAINVSDNAAYFYNKINEDLRIGGIDVKAEDNIDTIDGYKGEGYGVSAQHELENIIKISRTTGIVVDPVYNIKAIRGMLTEMKNNPERFKGKRIV